MSRGGVGGKVDANANVLRTMMPWLPFMDISTEEQEFETPDINMPDNGFITGLGGVAGGGGVNPDFQLPAPVQTDRQQLTQVDYEGATQVPYQEAIEALEATRPEAPEEESFMQKLDSWLIPAAAGGMLGPLGLLIGGLLGEGRRQDDVQAEDAQYQEALRQFEQGLVQDRLNLMKGMRDQELGTQESQQDQELANFDFAALQDQNDRAATQEQDRRVLDELRGEQTMAQTAKLGRDQMLQRLMLSGQIPGLQDDSAILTRALQLNPELYPLIAGSDAYANWRLNTQEGGDPIAAQAHLAKLIQEASKFDPQIAELFERLRQEQQLSSFLSAQ